MDYTLEDLAKAAEILKDKCFGKKDEYAVSFTKENDGCWYVDFPNWPFDHSHLQMVRGADKLCELLSYDGKHTKVSVIPSKENKIIQSYDLNERFKLIRTECELTEGATYQVQINQFKSVGAFIWLCPVTLFVLGEYPEYLYIKTLMKPLYKDFNSIF